MTNTRVRPRWIVLATVLAGLVVAFFVVRAAESSSEQVVKGVPAFQREFERGDEVPADLRAELAQIEQVDLGKARSVLREETPNGQRLIHVVPSVDGESLCFTAREDIGGGTLGCVRSAEFLGARRFYLAVSEDGHPDAPTRVAAYGVASGEVKRIIAHFTDRVLTASPTADGGFWLETDTAGARLEWVVAEDRQGNAFEKMVIPKG